MQITCQEDMIDRNSRGQGWKLFRYMPRIVGLFFLALSPSPSAAAADFRGLDAAFSDAIRISIVDPTYHAAKLRQLATDAGLTSDKNLFEGLNARQSIAQALDQIATSSFEKQLKEGRPPRPDDLQILTNTLATLGSLEKAEASTGPLNAVLRIRTRVFSLFVSPLIERPGRKDLRPLAESQSGVFLAQFLGGISGGGVRVLDLYAEPATYGLAWSLKTFSTPFPALRSVVNRAYFPDYSPRKDGVLGLVVDAGSLGEREKNDLFAQFDELQRAGLIVIIDDSVARLNACVENETERAERLLRDEQPEAAPATSKKAKKPPRSEALAGSDAATLTPTEIADIKRRCQTKVQMPSFDGRAILFDPARNVLVASFPNSSAAPVPLKSILADARYAVERWP